MKLVNSKINYSIEFKENIVNILVIENQSVMSQVVQSLWKQCNGNDGDFCLSEEKTLKIDKLMCTIINPFSIDFNNKKIISALYNNLAQNANDFIEEKAKINASIIALLDDIIDREDCHNIDYSLDFSWHDLFKIYNIKIEETQETLLISLIEYLKILVNYCGIKIVSFINLKSYLSEEEILELYKYSNYNKIQLLLIESTERTILQNEMVHIVDADKCIINKQF